MEHRAVEVRVGSAFKAIDFVSCLRCFGALSFAGAGTLTNRFLHCPVGLGV
jgi:hypothetical protein